MNCRILYICERPGSLKTLSVALCSSIFDRYILIIYQRSLPTLCNVCSIRIRNRSIHLTASSSSWKESWLVVASLVLASDCSFWSQYTT